MIRQIFNPKAAAILLVLMAGLLAQAETPEELIAERIKKVGDICLEGEACDRPQMATGDTATMTIASTGSAAKANYDKSCVTCHGAGVAGAPMLGDKGAWDDRIAKGMDVLYASSINGLAPAMPAKGMCFNCSDDDLKAIVDYMVDSVR